MIFHPWERPYYVSLLLTSIAVFYNIIFLTMRVTFIELEQDSSALIFWATIDYIADLIYLLDMFVQFRKGYLNDGILIQSGRKLCLHYLRSTHFKVDLLSVLPTDLIYFAKFPVRNLALVRLNRLIRFPRLMEFLDRTWRISSRPTLTRTATLVLYLLIIVHMNACTYYFVSELIGFGTDQFVFNVTAVPDIPGRYLHCVYWVAMIMTTGESLAVATGESPVTSSEMILAAFNVLLGILLFATIVGNIGALITAEAERRIAFHSWYYKLGRYMKRHRIRGPVVHQIGKWVEHYWLNERAAGGSDDALSLLPDRLQAEINMNVHLETLRRVKIFQDCDPGVLVALVNKLKLVMFNPLEFVCKVGDVGKEMYIVRSGQLSVMNAKDDVVGVLSAGAVFGELSLLNISGTTTGNRRTASVRSDGYSYMFRLTKEDLWAALQDYPNARRVFIDKGREILIRDGLLKKTTLVDSFKLLSNHKKLEHLEQQIEHIISKMSMTIVGIDNYERKLERRIRLLEYKFKQKSIV